MHIFTFFLTTFVALVSVLTTQARPSFVARPVHSPAAEAPITDIKSANASELQARGPVHHGKATWFTFDGTEGACGGWYSDYAAVVALPFWRQENCFRTVKITSSKGITKYAKAVDSCPTCAHFQLDLTYGFFQQFENPDVGMFDITWHFLD
ncbi:hypothetical protein OC861_004253 [Tilletia horrida]|nr:hypothetical protein OC861_004253 [Tilletia horrida]